MELPLQEPHQYPSCLGHCRDRSSRHLLRVPWRRPHRERCSAATSLPGLPSTAQDLTPAAVGSLQPLRDHGMWVFFYLNDLIVMAKSREWAMFHTAQFILHLTKLGFTINWKKSGPLPQQQVEYLGVVLDACRLRATLSEQTDGPAEGSWQTEAGCDGDGIDRPAGAGVYGGRTSGGDAGAAAHAALAEVVCQPPLGCQEAQARERITHRVQ